MLWDCKIPDDIDKEEAYLPVNVDSSQLKAITMASGGVSFVLHGPPGTGKSQTITAMIANALTKGQTVLFVAEKRAALDVVQKRLEALGIQDFCLELHANKSTKKSVLDQLERTLRIETGGVNTGYEDKLQAIQNMRNRLNAYARALHVRRTYGRSLRELLDLYENVPEQSHLVSFEKSFVQVLTENELTQQVYQLKMLVAAGREIGHPCGHPLAAVHKTEYSQSLKFDLRRILSEYMNSLDNLRGKAQAFGDCMGINPPVAEEEWDSVLCCARGVIAAGEIPEFLRYTENIDREFAPAEILLRKKMDFAAKKSEFLLNWNENFLRMDMSPYREKYDQAVKKIIGKGIDQGTGVLFETGGRSRRLPWNNVHKLHGG